MNTNRLRKLLEEAQEHAPLPWTALGDQRVRDAWMSATGTLTTPTPDTPKEGDDNE